MESTETAPAPPVEPTPIPATDQAVADNDVGKFREARLAERSGKPLPAVEIPPTNSDKIKETPIDTPPPVAAQPDRTISKRQQETNDRIRDAVDRATSELNAEVTRLRAQIAPAAPRSDPKQVATVADPEPDPTDTTTYPDGHFDLKFIKDQARWEARQAVQAHDAQQRQDTAKAETQQAITARDTAWNTRITEVEQADPDYWSKISPDVAHLKPFDRLTEGERPTAGNRIAEEILRAPYGPQLALHLSEHPDELTRLSRLLPHPLERALGRLEARFDTPAEQSPPPTKTISSAPAPVTTLGKKTTEPVNEVESAVASGDMSVFRAARLRERTALLRK